MAVPSGPQTGVKYVLTGPEGTRAVFNDTTDPDYVGMIEDIPGLDSPEIRENAENLVGMDGGIHGEFFFGRRPITITGQIINVVSPQDRNEKMTKLLQATNALRADATLEWTPSGGEPQFIKIRRQQAVKIKGGWVKEFQIALVSADPRIYSTALTTTTLGTYTDVAHIAAAGEKTGGVAVDATFIYWAHSIGTQGYIGRAKLNGTVSEPEWIKVGEFTVASVVVTATNVYWANTLEGAGATTGKSIGRATIAGATVTNTFITGLGMPDGLSTNGTYLFWTNRNTNSIGRALIGGTEVKPEFIKVTVKEQFVGTACNATFVYWANSEGHCMGRAEVGGTKVEQEWLKNINACYLPAVDATYIYWSEYFNDTIGRALLTGASVETEYMKGSAGGRPYGTAVDGTYLYFVEHQSSTIARAPLALNLLNNKGDEIMYPIIKVTGNLENPTIRNNTTKEQITLDYSSLGANQNFVTGVSIPSVAATDGTYMYFVTENSLTIDRVRLDGTEHIVNWATANPSGVGLGINGIAVIGANLCINMKEVGSKNTIYTTKTTIVNWIPLEGTEPATEKNGLAAQGANLYYIEAGTSIKKAVFVGGARTTVVSGINASTLSGGALAVDKNFVYYKGKATEIFIGRVTLAGTGLEASWLNVGPEQVIGIATDEGHIYWSNAGTNNIGRAEISGASVERTWSSGESRPWGIFVSGEVLYWANSNLNSVGMKKLKATPATAVIDTLNRTVKVGNESVYRTVDFPLTSWWGLIPGNNSISAIGATAAEALTVEVLSRNAWI